MIARRWKQARLGPIVFAAGRTTGDRDPLGVTMGRWWLHVERRRFSADFWLSLRRLWIELWRDENA